MEKTTHMELLVTKHVQKNFVRNADIVCKNDLTFEENRWLDTRTQRLYDVIWEIDGEYAYAIAMRGAYDK